MFVFIITLHLLLFPLVVALHVLLFCLVVALHITPLSPWRGAGGEAGRGGCEACRAGNEVK